MATDAAVPPDQPRRPGIFPRRDVNLFDLLYHDHPRYKCCNRSPYHYSAQIAYLDALCNLASVVVMVSVGSGGVFRSTVNIGAFAVAISLLSVFSFSYGVYRKLTQPVLLYVIIKVSVFFIRGSLTAFFGSAISLYHKASDKEATLMKTYRIKDVKHFEKACYIYIGTFGILTCMDFFCIIVAMKCRRYLSDRRASVSAASRVVSLRVVSTGSNTVGGTADAGTTPVPPPPAYDDVVEKPPPYSVAMEMQLSPQRLQQQQQQQHQESQQPDGHLSLETVAAPSTAIHAGSSQCAPGGETNEHTDDHMTSTAT